MDRLRSALRALFETLGTWADEEQFEQFGDILEDAARAGGVVVTRLDGEGVIDVPFTLDTMP